jgi:hypothetical protein
MSAGTKFSRRGGGLPTCIPTQPGTVEGEPLVWSITNNKWSPQSGTWYFTNTTLYGTNVSVSTVTASGKIRAASEDITGTLLAAGVVSPTAVHSSVVASGLITSTSAVVTGTSVAANFTSPLASHTTLVNSGLITTGTLTSTGLISAASENISGTLTAATGIIPTIASTTIVNSGLMTSSIATVTNLATVGNLNTAGSVVAATQVTTPTVMSTNVTASGVVVADGATLQLGTLPTGVSIARGLQTKSVDNELALWGIRTDGAGANAVSVIADVNKASIDDEMHIARFAWVNDSNVVTDSFYIKDGGFEFPTAGSVELFSSEADNPGVTAVTLGTESTFTIPVIASGLHGPRATLLSIVNGPISSGEKFSVDVTGNVCMNKNYEGQSLCFKSLPEDLTVPATLSGYTTAAIIPSGCIVYAVSSYVTQSIPGVNTFDVGVDGASTKYGTKLLALQGSSWRGTEGTGTCYTQDTPVRITPNTTPTAATGRVRVTIHYIEVTPPTQ